MNTQMHGATGARAPLTASVTSKGETEFYLQVEVAPNVPHNERFSGWNWLLIVIGLAMLLLILLALLLPAEAV